MRPLKIIFLVLFCSALSALTGGAAGYFAAVSTPAASTIAVLDVEQLASTIDPGSPDHMARASRLAAQTKEITARLTAAGVVVIDRAHVISAPEDSIIHVDAQSN